MVKKGANKDILSFKDVPMPESEFISNGLKGERNWNSTKKLMLKTMITRPTIREKFIQGVRNKNEENPNTYTKKYIGITDGKIGILSTKVPLERKASF